MSRRGYSLISGSARRRVIDPTAALPWDNFALPANASGVGNGNKVPSWVDSLGGTKPTVQADTDKQPLFIADGGSVFNHRPVIRGSGSSALRWNRGTPLAPPYFYWLLYKRASGITGYSSLLSDFSSSTGLWFTTSYGADSAHPYESFLCNGNDLIFPYRPGGAQNVFLVVKTGATGGELWVNGSRQIGQVGVEASNGAALFTFPSADIFGSADDIAGWGLCPGVPSDYPSGFANFNQWADDYFSLGLAAKTTLYLYNDSRTPGSGSVRKGASDFIASGDHGLSWGAQLRKNLTADVNVVSLGMSSRRMGVVGTSGTAADDFSLYLGPALTAAQNTAGKKIVICINAGTNDAVADGVSAATTYGRLMDFVDMVHAAGAQIVLGTSPCGFGYDSGQQSRIKGVNTLVLANAGRGSGTPGLSDGVADRIADIANDADITATNPWAYDFGGTGEPFTPGNFYPTDKTHFFGSVTAGHKVVADQLLSPLAALGVS